MDDTIALVIRHEIKAVAKTFIAQGASDRSR